MGRGDGGGSDGNIDGGLHGCSRDSECAYSGRGLGLRRRGLSIARPQEFRDRWHRNCWPRSLMPSPAPRRTPPPGASWVSATSGAGAQRIQFCRVYNVGTIGHSYVQGLSTDNILINPANPALIGTQATVTFQVSVSGQVSATNTGLNVGFRPTCWGFGACTSTSTNAAVSAAAMLPIPAIRAMCLAPIAELRCDAGHPERFNAELRYERRAPLLYG